MLAPRAQVVVVQGALDYADGESKAFIAGDGVLFLLGLAAGVLSGLLAWWLRSRATVGVLALVLGSALGSYLAWKVGTVGGDRAALLAAARDGRLTGPAALPLELRAKAVLLAWPGAAAASLAVRGLRARSREAAAVVPAVPAVPADWSAPEVSAG